MLCNISCVVNYVTKKLCLEFMKNKKTSIGSNLWYKCHHRKPKKLHTMESHVDRFIENKLDV
jgi:hypothetical protein